MQGGGVQAGFARFLYAYTGAQQDVAAGWRTLIDHRKTFYARQGYDGPLSHACLDVAEEFLRNRIRCDPGLYRLWHEYQNQGVYRAGHRSPLDDRV